MSIGKDVRFMGRITRKQEGAPPEIEGEDVEGHHIKFLIQGELVMANLLGERLPATTGSGQQVELVLDVIDGDHVAGHKFLSDRNDKSAIVQLVWV